ncbi:MAG: DUF2357 domain-containing protein [Oscillospiraceae bacterium]|nr:DUF2357 domain-containing protein [Oscillospiraceae bacterium]
MGKYSLTLHNNYSSDVLMKLYDTIDETITENDIIVFDNYNYQFIIQCEDDEILNIDSIYINDEYFECNVQIHNNKATVTSPKNNMPFIGCYGVAKISIIIEGQEYVSPEISVFVKEENQSDNINKMIEYIYNNCENFLYEKHYKNKQHVGINKFGENSIEVKLNQLDSILNLYSILISFFENSPNSKLINKNEIDSFEKLTTVTPQTLKYITTHVDELEKTKINSGIKFAKQFFQPKNTLVKSVTYTLDTYENNVIVGFLFHLIKELNQMKKTVNEALTKTKQYRKINGYIESKFFIYQRSKFALEKHINKIEELINKYQQLYYNYKTTLSISGIEIVTVPKFTNVFRNIIPYQQIFEKIYEWFNSGGYNLSQDTLLLSFLNTSKIYEYYCLIRINCYLKNIGYILMDSNTYLYDEDIYYRNTRYCNTFVFKKEDTEITVYFQPKISTGLGNKKRNNISLFRNSTHSVRNAAKKGSYYSPDYIIKISKYNKVNYFILDAKFSEQKKVKEYQMSELVFKYLFSISSFEENEKLSGMYILCGRTDNNRITDLHDISDSIGVITIPVAKLFDITTLEENDSIIEALFNELLRISY